MFGRHPYHPGMEMENEHSPLIHGLGQPGEGSEPVDPEEDPRGTAPTWRRPFLIGVAALTAAAMALIPIYNVISGGRRVADNGLEVCGFDYCVVQDAAIAAGLNEEMSALANTFLSDEEAGALAAALLERVGRVDVSFIVVEKLDGDIEGRFDPAAGAITVERPVRAWMIVHEVAHAEQAGHGEEFQRVLIELTRWLAETALLPIPGRQGQ